MAGGDPAIEDRLADGVARLVRQFVYAATLHDPKAGVRALLLDGVVGSQAWLARVLWPITRRRMATVMQATPDRLPAIAAAIDAELDWFEVHRAGRDHLVGDGFGRADLTAASLMSVFLRHERKGPRLTLHEDAAAMMARWGRHPAIVWTAGIYAAHRHAPIASHADTALSSESRRQAPLE